MNTPMTPAELAGWTAQQSARHEQALARSRAAYARPAVRGPRGTIPEHNGDAAPTAAEPT